MSYEPDLIIRKNDLDKIVPILEKERYCGDEEKEKIAKYLLDVSKFDPIVFDDLSLIICSPEFSTFNRKIREKLHKHNVDFRTDF